MQYSDSITRVHFGLFILARIREDYNHEQEQEQAHVHTAYTYLHAALIYRASISTSPRLIWMR